MLGSPVFFFELKSRIAPLKVLVLGYHGNEGEERSQHNPRKQPFQEKESNWKIVCRELWKSSKLHGLQDGPWGAGLTVSDVERSECVKPCHNQSERSMVITFLHACVWTGDRLRGWAVLERNRDPTWPLSSLIYWRNAGKRKIWTQRRRSANRCGVITYPTVLVT